MSSNILVSSTIHSASTRRIRHTKSRPSVPMTAQQKKEKAAERQATQDAIQEAVDEWFSSTKAKAEDLAQRFDRKPRYFLDLFFHGGARMIHQREKVNPYNAFMSVKAQELRDAGDKRSLLEIQETFKDEYCNLEDAEREEVIREYEDIRTGSSVTRVAPRGRVQDFANTVRNMTALLEGLKVRIGVEGFFCIVRNSTSYHMAPQWYFTSEALEKYMKTATKLWATHDVGTRLEAFAIAGCDPINLLTSSKKKADFYKSEIRDLITSKLREITGNPHAVMQYSRYEEDIVMRYGIVLEGWTYEKLINPSALSTSLPSLKILHDALIKGDCKFVKMTSEQKKEWENTYTNKIKAGEAETRKRKKRSDAGVRWKNKRVRSSGEVPSDDDKENDGDSGENGVGCDI